MNKNGPHRPPALTIDPPPCEGTSLSSEIVGIDKNDGDQNPDHSTTASTSFDVIAAAAAVAFAGQLQHPPAARRRPVSAMASLPWLSYQSPRDDVATGTSGAEDDEDCALESTLFLSTSPSFHSPMPGSVSSLALSPPGLSPLNFNDGSPFSVSSTPSSTSSLAANRNRFTFDHIPFLGGCSTSSTTNTANNPSPLTSTQKSAFEVVSSHQNADEILQRVRLGTSGSSSTSARTSQSQSTSDSGIGGDKQYYCHTCKKDFKRPDILSRHLRRHTGEKPFGCDACGRFFSRSDHLRTHRRTHTDEKPYQCTICSYSARRRDVLTRHMITRHQTTAPTSNLGSSTHRNVRRCHSDGDYHKATAMDRRQRHQTNHVQPDEMDIPTMEYMEDDVIVDDDV